MMTTKTKTTPSKICAKHLNYYIINISNRGFEIIIDIKDRPFILTSRHGLRLVIILGKRFDQILWFFRNVIYNPKGKLCRLDFSCKSLYLIVFVHFKKPWHISDIYMTPRNSLCKSFIPLWTYWIFTKPLDWIFWNNAHSAFNHAFSKVYPKIEWN